MLLKFKIEPDREVKNFAFGIPRDHIKIEDLNLIFHIPNIEDNKKKAINNLVSNSKVLHALFKVEQNEYAELAFVSEKLIKNEKVYCVNKINKNGRLKNFLPISRHKTLMGAKKKLFELRYE